MIAFSIASLINLPGTRGVGVDDHHWQTSRQRQIGQAERQLRHVFLALTIGLTAIARGTAPFAG
ncbi:hypothetical protein ACVXG7_19090 [Enterobacter hormaechei]